MVRDDTRSGRGTRKGQHPPRIVAWVGTRWQPFDEPPSPISLAPSEFGTNGSRRGSVRVSDQRYWGGAMFRISFFNGLSRPQATIRGGLAWCSIISMPQDRKSVNASGRNSGVLGSRTLDRNRGYENRKEKIMRTRPGSNRVALGGVKYLVAWPEVLIPAVVTDGKAGRASRKSVTSAPYELNQARI